MIVNEAEGCCPIPSNSWHSQWNDQFNWWSSVEIFRNFLVFEAKSFSSIYFLHGEPSSQNLLRFVGDLNWNHLNIIRSRFVEGFDTWDYWPVNQLLLHALRDWVDWWLGLIYRFWLSDNLTLALLSSRILVHSNSSWSGASHQLRFGRTSWNHSWVCYWWNIHRLWHIMRIGIWWRVVVPREWWWRHDLGRFGNPDIGPLLDLDGRVSRVMSLLAVFTQRNVTLRTLESDSDYWVHFTSWTAMTIMDNFLSVPRPSQLIKVDLLVCQDLLAHVGNELRHLLNNSVDDKFWTKRLSQIRS